MLDIKVKELSNDEIVVKADGDINRKTIPVLRINLEKATKGSHKIITINFSDAHMSDVSLFGLILRIKKNLSEEGKTIRIRGCNGSIYSQFSLLMLDRSISIEK